MKQNSQSQQAETTKKAETTKPAQEGAARSDAQAVGAATAAQGVMRSPMQGLQAADVLALQSSAGNMAVQRLISSSRVQRKEPEGGTGGAATTATDPATAKAEAITAYKTWLEARLVEVAALQGDEKVRRVRGLLSQVESVSVNLIAGTLPEVDKLSTTPDYQDGGARGYVPPELIGTVRQFIQLIEKPVENATQVTDTQVEGSLYDTETDWNARLGVPQYRTQSDNLAAPEATCNVTSFAMVAERLGYSREDLLTAIDGELHTSYLKTEDGKAAVKDKKPEEVEVPDTYWQEKAKAYLEKVNSDSESYRKLRGGKMITVDEAKVKEKKGAAAQATERQRQIDEQMTALTGDFKGNAQSEDLLDFFLYLQNITRTTINSGTTPKTLLDKLNPDDSKEHRTEQLWDWSDSTKTKLKECLAAGGAAVYSLYHKGAGQAGTHIITIQSVTENGIIVDDPYGQINPDYRRNKAQDAFAPTGKQGASTRTSDYKNKVDATDTKTDWEVDSAQDATDSETLGDSYELSNDVVKSAFFYIVLFHRAEEKKK